MRRPGGARGLTTMRRGRHVPSELFELKVMIEADGWHEIAALMDSVDRALDPHRQAHEGERRWSVTARRVPDAHSHELLRFLDQCGAPLQEHGIASEDRLTA
jgi:hypothetical protein